MFTSYITNFFCLLQKQFVHLTLIEAPAKESGDTPIYINEVLLNEGFAVASPEVNDVTNSSNSSIVGESGSNKIKVLTTKEVLSKLYTSRKAE